MTMLSISRRLGITPRPDHEYDPAAAGWLDSGRPESAHQEAGRRAYVPQQWAGTNAVRDRERAHAAADDQAAAGQTATARGPHPLGGAEPEAAPPWSSGSSVDTGPAEAQPIDQQATARLDGAWPAICDEFGSHMLVLAEQLRAALNVLEEGEEDPERLKRLYQVDHAATRMRLASRQLRTLTGRNEERMAGFTTSLLDVIRMATSAIEWYPQVSVGPVVDLAVPGFAADDVATLMSALLDNATRYSPGMVAVSCHLLEEGGVMFRIEDTGIGIAQAQVMRLNFALAGPVPDIDESAGRHTGFPVVHRIARKQGISVRFASRPRPASGTLAMVTLPPQLLCAIPAQDPPRRAPAAGRSAPQAATSAVPDLPRREPTGLAEAASVDATTAQPAPPQAAPADAAPSEPVSPEAVSLVTVLPETVSVVTVSPETASQQPALPETASLVTVSPETASQQPALPQAVSAEAVSAEPEQDAPPIELPRRERPGLPADASRPGEVAVPPQPQPQPQPQPPQPPQAAARRAFADDLSLFSQGIQEALAARGITGGLVSAMFEGAAIEEGAHS
jgi:Histidine kinase-, DNA gyrase B-, and HSP90-like ATPase